jgi:site-specific DNA recombinase
LCLLIWGNSKHYKKLKSGETRRHVYYHCTRRKKDIKCTQKKYINETELEKQIIELLSNITILPEFKDWAIEILKREHTAEVFCREDVQRSYQQNINEVQRRMDVLLDLRLNAEINNETYQTKNEKLQKERQDLDKNLKTVFERADNWLETAEKAFGFACHAREIFLTGDLKTKREILMALGSNFLMKDGKLMITRHLWLEPIAKSYKGIEAEYLEFEPAERLVDTDQNGVEKPHYSSWSGQQDTLVLRSTRIVANLKLRKARFR